MKFLTLLSGITMFVTILLIGVSPMNGCKKTGIAKDTTTVYDLKDGLVAYYDFKGGSLNDASGHNNNIVFNNATKTADRFGNGDNAYLFDGVGNYMQVKSSSSLNLHKMTLMAVVKLNKFYVGECHGNIIFSKGVLDVHPATYGLKVLPSPMTYCYNPPDTSTEAFGAFFGDERFMGQAIDAPGTVHTNQWATVIYAFDSSRYKLYVNGELKIDYYDATEDTLNNEDLFIGKEDDVEFPFWFGGVIDEIRIYNKALPAGAIKELNSLKN
jgi:hypothetical protein